MAAGYNDSTSPKLTLEEFYLLANAGDLEDLVNLPTATLAHNVDLLGQGTSLVVRVDSESSRLEPSGLVATRVALQPNVTTQRKRRFGTALGRRWSARA
jgi:hypothetical protein